VLRSNPHALVGGRVFNALGGNPYATASQLLIDYLCAEYTQGGQPRFLTSNNLALTRTAFVQLGGFDGSFPLPAGEDREFSERWRRSGGNIQYVGGPVVNHLHELTLRGFLLQHFRYGRGARRLHQVGRRNGWESIRVEPLRFYLKLLMFPRVGSSTRPISCHWLSVLLLTSQVAGVAGYTYEIMSPQAARL
jgi:GT2 family glycosyltransferase